MTFNSLYQQNWLTWTDCFWNNLENTGYWKYCLLTRCKFDKRRHSRVKLSTIRCGFSSNTAYILGGLHSKEQRLQTFEVTCNFNVNVKQHAIKEDSFWKTCFKMNVNSTKLTPSEAIDRFRSRVTSGALQPYFLVVMVAAASPFYTCMRLRDKRSCRYFEKTFVLQKIVLLAVLSCACASLHPHALQWSCTKRI